MIWLEQVFKSVSGPRLTSRFCKVELDTTQNFKMLSEPIQDLWRHLQSGFRYRATWITLMVQPKILRKLQPHKTSLH